MQTVAIETRPCPGCGARSEVNVTVEEAEALMAGAHVQDALPNHSAADRERLISGMCGPCWERLVEDE